MMASNMKVSLGGIPASLSGLPLTEEQKIVYILSALIWRNTNYSILLQSFYFLLDIFKMHSFLAPDGLFTGGSLFDIRSVLEILEFANLPGVRGERCVVLLQELVQPSGAVIQELSVNLAHVSVLPYIIPGVHEVDLSEDLLISFLSEL